MAQVSAHAPNDRLINLARSRFGADPEFGAHPTYWCPRCDQETRFQLGRKRPTAFTHEITAALDEASGPAVPWETDYTDLCCLGCEQPVRVTHSIHEFAMSSYRYVPLRVYTLDFPLLTAPGR